MEYVSLSDVEVRGWGRCGGAVVGLAVSGFRLVMLVYRRVSFFSIISLIMPKRGVVDAVALGEMWLGWRVVGLIARSGRRRMVSVASDTSVLRAPLVGRLSSLTSELEGRQAGVDSSCGHGPAWAHDIVVTYSYSGHSCSLGG